MRILVSTSDKTGLLEFLRPLLPLGLELISTGGTFDYLKKNEFTVTEVSELTGFPEVLDGRVKTLHPFVHMGILADKSNEHHMAQLKVQNVKAFDMVIGNLYPFEKTASNPNASFEDLIENIDIGGPSFLRASAKNFPSVIVMADPADYSWVQKKILDKTMTLEDRKRLALKVFSLTSYYDALIVDRLCENKEELSYLNLPLKKNMSLRYGENSHQKAVWYKNPLESYSLSDATIHQGKELSYNNILDLEAAAGLVRLLEKPACVAVKHNNPCGAAQADQLATAAEKTIQADPKSIFGGIVACNRPVDLKTAELFKDIFLECLIAPDFSDEALKLFSAKKNLRILGLASLQDGSARRASYKSVAGGALFQEDDTFAADWEFLGQKPSAALLEDMVFGEKVCAYLKSNAIAVVCGGQTVGLGMGQVNRVDAVRHALERTEECKSRAGFPAGDTVLVSDAFFPFPDSVDLIAKAGIRWVVQPGGSVQDEKVFAAAKEKNINMVITKRRHFRH